MTLKELLNAINAFPEDVLKNDSKLIIGGRSYGKSFQQNLAILKKWPKGKVLNVKHDEVKVSELANAEEIKED